MSKPLIISINSFKRGVGKTSISIQLDMFLKEQGVNSIYINEEENIILEKSTDLIIEELSLKEEVEVIIVNAYSLGLSLKYADIKLFITEPDEEILINTTKNLNYIKNNEFISNKDTFIIANKVPKQKNILNQLLPIVKSNINFSIYNSSLDEVERILEIPVLTRIKYIDKIDTQNKVKDKIFNKNMQDIYKIILEKIG